MSTETVNETIPARRERRITIKLDNNSNQIRQQQQKQQLANNQSSPIVGRKHTYEAGDEISGAVLLQIFGGQPVSKVTLALVCLTQVRWIIESNGGNYRRKSIMDTLFKSQPGSQQQIEQKEKENQIYFDRQNIVEIELAKNLDSKLINGKCEIPFKFYLPNDGLPSTMNGCYGFVKYTIEVFTLDEDRNRSRGETEIIVVAPIEPKLDLNVGEHLEKSLSVPGSGKIILHGSLDRKAYVAGDIVPVKVSIENNLNVPVQPQLSLYQTQVFECNRSNRALETCLSSEPIEGEMVPALNSSTELIDLPLMPNLVVSLKSSLITVKYFVDVSVDIPNLFDLHVSLPFVITTRRAFNQQGRHGLVSSQIHNTNNSVNRNSNRQQQPPPNILPLSSSHVAVDSSKLIRVNSNSNRSNNNNNNGKRSNV